MRSTHLHGLSYTPEYRAWQTMRLRCTNPANAAYSRYGGRGIRVCDRWMRSVEAFMFDMGRKPSPAHELDRKDNDGHYEPGNCRWVLRKVNDRNRSNNRRITYEGETHALAEWCERFAVPQSTVAKRLDLGWTIEEALTIPVREKAEDGKARSPKKQCVDCPKQVFGTRCKSCENRRRYRDQLQAAVA